jgi:hypothetical protein
MKQLFEKANQLIQDLIDIRYKQSDLLIKLNKAAFYMMGDMNWHNHAGLRIIAVKSAIQFNVPLFIYGEVSWDISGMFSINDYSEFNKRTVLEHDMRGFTINDFSGKEGLKLKDLYAITLSRRHVISNLNVKFRDKEQHRKEKRAIKKFESFLRKKNLLKVGSDAPNDVLRQIYEQSILSGDVENKAKDVLIHNYMNH